MTAAAAALNAAAQSAKDVAAAIDAIAAIGEVAYTDESKALIEAAQAAFDALTPAQQALVENKDALDAEL